MRVPATYTDTTPSASRTTEVTRSRCRACRQSGSPTRHTSTEAAAAIQAPHQKTVRPGEPTNCCPVHSWCGSARPTPR